MSKALQQAQQSNLPLATQQLTSANNVRKTGTGTINGMPVTEYTGSYSLAAALAKAAGQRPVDRAADRCRRRFQDRVLPDLASKENMAISMIVTSINQPVTVQLPPAAQVATVPASALKS